MISDVIKFYAEVVEIVEIENFLVEHFFYFSSFIYPKIQYKAIKKHNRHISNPGL